MTLLTFIFFHLLNYPKQARLQATEADEQIESLEHELKRIKDLEQHKEQQQNDKYQKIYQERHQEQEEELKNNKLEMEKQKDELMQLKNQANEASKFAKDESRKVYIGRKFRKHAGKVVSATHQPNKTNIVKRKKRFSAILNEITLEGDSTDALVMGAEQTIIVGGMKHKTFSHHAMHPRQETTPVPSVFADDDLDLMLPVSKINSNKNIVSSKSNRKEKGTETEKESAMERVAQNISLNAEKAERIDAYGRVLYGNEKSGLLKESNNKEREDGCCAIECTIS
jgi:CO dehydrogenase nickel-insertion accessory protein CooC1